MESNAFAQCYTEQGGDALFIFSSSGKIPDKTKMAQLFCDRKYYPNNYPTECIKATTTKIIILSSKETPCVYAPDTQKCNTCATIIGLQQNVVHYSLFGLFAILSLISLTYILVVGGFYLLKKRLLGPKWLLIITSLIFILSISLFLYF